MFGQVVAELLSPNCLSKFNEQITLLVIFVCSVIDYPKINKTIFVRFHNFPVGTAKIKLL